MSFELTKAMIEAARPACISKISSHRREEVRHMGGKVLVPTRQAIAHLIAARWLLMSVVCRPVIIARTDANARSCSRTTSMNATTQFLTGDRTAEGLLPCPWRDSTRQSRAACSYAHMPTWSGAKRRSQTCVRRKRFAETVHAKFPGKLLAYNCSPSFNWKKKLDGATIAKFQRELGAMGYKFQFVTLAGFHALN